jgi:hypothetical protein
MDTKEFKILKPHDEYGWVTALICGRWVQAKVFDRPSSFGINSGRISKLVISKTDSYNSNRDFLSQMDFNYDRGLDFNKINNGLLETIILTLESLPKRFDEAGNYLNAR